MNREPEPEFLTREIVEAIHEDQIETRGGLHGLRDGNALESAIAAARNVYHYGGGDPFEIAAAYAYHIAESQAYFDGNKRTGAQAVLVFWEIDSQVTIRRTGGKTAGVTVNRRQDRRRYREPAARPPALP
jgi:death-on-curing protein